MNVLFRRESKYHVLCCDKGGDILSRTKESEAKPIAVENIRPAPGMVTPAERKRIEEALFDIFKKYECENRTIEV